jgi:hypothetical protein
VALAILRGLRIRPTVADEVNPVWIHIVQGLQQWAKHTACLQVACIWVVTIRVGHLASKVLMSTQKKRQRSERRGAGMSDRRGVDSSTRRVSPGTKTWEKTNRPGLACFSSDPPPCYNILIKTSPNQNWSNLPEPD